MFIHTRIKCKHCHEILCFFLSFFFSISVEMMFFLQKTKKQKKKQKTKKSVEMMFVQPLPHMYNYDEVMIIN